MRIKMLNSDTINQIAAGEVVVRPASVVKELVENAIDASATRIEVAVEEGGRKLIRISDNGIGIPYNEVPMAFKRHATSKLTSIDDLIMIGTLGFRGEALSSIAAVSKIKLTTRFKEEELGSQTILENGKVISSVPIGRNIGTSIEVHDLFYNIPARQKHMGKAQTEAAHINDIMEKLAMSHPEMAFTYIHNNKKVFSTFGDGTMANVIENIYGRSFFDGLIPINYENLPMKITGYIGGLTVMKKTKDYQVFFVNDRYIKSNFLSKAFEEAYEGYVMQHCHPVGILNISLPQKMLDVNIHPAKTEIGILNQSLITLLFKQGIRETLRQNDLSVQMKLDDQNIGLEKSEEYSENIIQPEQLVITDKPQIDYLFPSDFDQKNHIDDEVEGNKNQEKDNHKLEYNFPVLPEYDNSQGVAETAKTTDSIIDESEKEIWKPQISFENVKIIGQLFKTYILLEKEDEALLIDQHAAHEAFMYHELKARFQNHQAFPSQLLLAPQCIGVDKRTGLLFDEIKSKLSYYGFECEKNEDNTITVKSVPLVLGYPLKVEMLQDYIDTLVYQDVEPDKSLETRKIITMACKAAVKGNQVLSYHEIEGLLARLERIDNPFTCPHGRPIIFRIKKYELEKMFKRVV